MSIYNIDREYLEIISQIEENLGEIDEETLAKLDSNQEDFKRSLLNLTNYVLKLNGDLDLIKSEKERLDDLKERKEKTVESLKKYISSSLKVRELKKYDLGTIALSFRKSSSLWVANDEFIPLTFYNEKITKILDKTALKKHIESGNEISGVEILEKENLQIK